MNGGSTDGWCAAPEVSTEGRRMTGDENNNGSGRNQPDYEALDTPDPQEEPYPEWSWAERRAYIFREWMDAGAHQLMDKSALARRFDVSRDTIYNDLDRIAGFVEESMGDRHGAETVATFQKAVKELLDEGKYKKAAEVQNMTSDWLERRGAIDRDEQSHPKVEADLDEETVEMLEGLF